MRIYRDQYEEGRVILKDSIEGLTYEIIKPSIAKEIELKNKITLLKMDNNNKPYSVMLEYIAAYVRIDGKQYKPEDLAATFDDEFLGFLMNKINDVNESVKKN